MKRLSQLVVLIALIGAHVALAAEAPVGTWHTIDENTGKVVSDAQLYEQGGKLSGRTTDLTTPDDAPGKPTTCTACKGADKDQPIVDLVTIQVWGEDGRLEIRGSVGPFYKTQTWNKAD
jgi:hypothetical protein